MTTKAKKMTDKTRERLYAKAYSSLEAAARALRQLSENAPNEEIGRKLRSAKSDAIGAQILVTDAMTAWGKIARDEARAAAATVSAPIAPPTVV